MDLEDIKAASKDPIQKVFAMDHDFVCISKQADKEGYDQEFMRGLDFYFTGDWHPAKNCFMFCLVKIEMSEVLFKHDGPLNRLIALIDRHKMFAPEDWIHGAPNAYDWDKKPVPPEVDFAYMNEEGEESEENNNS